MVDPATFEGGVHLTPMPLSEGGEDAVQVFVGTVPKFTLVMCPVVRCMAEVVEHLTSCALSAIVEVPVALAWRGGLKLSDAFTAHDTVP
jgi:hypothetical protein